MRLELSSNSNFTWLPRQRYTYYYNNKHSFKTSNYVYAVVDHCHSLLVTPQHQTLLELDKKKTNVRSEKIYSFEHIRFELDEKWHSRRLITHWLQSNLKSCLRMRNGKTFCWNGIYQRQIEIAKLIKSTIYQPKLKWCAIISLQWK